MKIQRDGIQIELTDEELFAAYCEQEHKFDLDSCKCYLDATYCEEEWSDDLSDEQKAEIIEEAASELRRNINKYDMDFNHAISDAFETVIKEGRNG